MFSFAHKHHEYEHFFIYVSLTTLKFNVPYYSTRFPHKTRIKTSYVKFQKSCLNSLFNECFIAFSKQGVMDV